MITLSVKASFFLAGPFKEIVPPNATFTSYKLTIMKYYVAVFQDVSSVLELIYV